MAAMMDFWLSTRVPSQSKTARRSGELEELSVEEGKAGNLNFSVNGIGGRPATGSKVSS
jgi:hypothetical protein